MPSSFFSIRLVSVHVEHPYGSIGTTAAWKKLRFILSVRSIPLAILPPAMDKWLALLGSLNFAIATNLWERKLWIQTCYTNLARNRLRTSIYEKLQTHAHVRAHTHTHTYVHAHIIGLTMSEEGKGWMARESQRNPCSHHALMMMRLISVYFKAVLTWSLEFIFKRIFNLSFCLSTMGIVYTERDLGEMASSLFWDIRYPWNPFESWDLHLDISDCSLT